VIAVVVVEAAAIVLLGVLVVGLLRSHAEILKALHDLGAGLDPDSDDVGVRGRAGRSASTSASTSAGTNNGGQAVGEEAYDVGGTLPDGSMAAVGVAGVPHDTVLAFLSTGCLTCQPFWEEFRGGVALPEGARLVVVVQDGDNQKKVRKLAGDDLLVVASDEAWEQYGVPGSPHFVYVDGPSGRVTGEGTGEEWEQVADLIDQASGGRPRRGSARQPGVNPPLLDPADDPTHRDNPTRIDDELLASGIGPGHPSLFAPVDDEVTERDRRAADVEAG
jgi:hypothetical protein